LTQFFQVFLFEKGLSEEDLGITIQSHNFEERHLELFFSLRYSSEQKVFESSKHRIFLMSSEVARLRFLLNFFEPVLSINCAVQLFTEYKLKSRLCRKPPSVL
jgi:hypothetical protein